MTVVAAPSELSLPSLWRMKRLKSILALSAFFVVVAGLSACGSDVSGNSVADMAGNPISKAAFKHWMFVAATGSASQSPGSPVIVPTDPPDFKDCIAQARAQIPALASRSNSELKRDCSQLFTSLSSQVMDFLIRSYWYQAQAHQQHVNVTDAQVQQAFQAAKKQQFPTEAAFQSFLASSGQTLQDILYSLRVKQIYLKLVEKYTSTVSEAQIQAYYNSHASQFGTPEARDIRIVRTNNAGDAAAAKAALQQGQAWNVVAKKYSIDAATKGNGGLLSGVTKGEEEQTVDTAAFSAPVGKLLGPIHGQFGYYVLDVTKVTPATHQTLAQATALIKQILSGQQQTSAQTAVDNQAKKNWLPKTNCQSLYAMADCNGYKAPHTTTATTATPTTTSAPSTTTPSTTTTKTKSSG